MLPASFVLVVHCVASCVSSLIVAPSLLARNYSPSVQVHALPLCFYDDRNEGVARRKINIHFIISASCLIRHGAAGNVSMLDESNDESRTKVMAGKA